LYFHAGKDRSDSQFLKKHVKNVQKSIKHVKKLKNIYFRFFGCSPIDGSVAKPRNQSEIVGFETRRYSTWFGRFEKSGYSTFSH
jgi:hypothetical protein